METTETTQTLATLASEALGHFERKTRANGDRFFTTDLTSEPDHWITDMIRDAHADCLPDDYKYEFIRDALIAITENDDIDDITFEADPYTSNLTKWLHSRVDRLEYCDRAVEEYGKVDSTVQLLMIGYEMEMREVFNSVRTSLEQRLELLGLDQL